MTLFYFAAFEMPAAALLTTPLAPLMTPRIWPPRTDPPIEPPRAIPAAERAIVAIRIYPSTNAKRAAIRLRHGIESGL